MSSSYLDSLFSLKGKTALITGGTRGIGAKIALALSKAGADLILVQRNTTNTQTKDAIEAAGGKADIVVADLADKSSIEQLIPHVTKELGRTLDIVVNCGGIQRRHPVENFPNDDWEEVIQVNMNTVFTITRDAGRHMLETRGGVAGEAAPGEFNKNGNGKIINISSLVAFQGGLNVVAYAAAKHGVQGMVKSFSNGWASKGVNVNAIAPGYIATDMNEALIADPVRSKQILERIPAGRWGSGEDFEGAVVFLASRASDYVSGECLVVDGGWMGSESGYEMWVMGGCADDKDNCIVSEHVQCTFRGGQMHFIPRAFVLAAQDSIADRTPSLSPAHSFDDRGGRPDNSNQMRRTRLASDWT